MIDEEIEETGSEPSSVESILKQPMMKLPLLNLRGK